MNSSLYHSNRPPNPLGLSSYAQPFLFSSQMELSTRAVGYGASIGVGLIACALGISFNTPTMTVALCSLLLLIGLPHGTLDINLLTKHVKRPSSAAVWLILLYCGCAGTMLLLWHAQPILALGIFLLISVIHFAEDWAHGDNDFFALGTATAVLCLPALFHNAELRELFASLTNSQKSGILVDGMTLLTPVACCVAFAAQLANLRLRHYDTVLISSATLAAMLFLPPLLGFTLYFCLYHSPHHLHDSLRQFKADAPRQVKIAVVPVTLAAFGIAAFVFFISPEKSFGAASLSTAFITLSILTVPHMAVPRIFELLRIRESTESGAHFVKLLSPRPGF